VSWTAQHVTREGVTSPAWTVIDCAKDLPFDEALAIADSALRHGDVTKAELLRLAEQVTSTGRRRALRVAQAADGRAANPFAFHGRRRAMKRDCERYNALVLCGWIVLRFTWEHVMFQPDYVAGCLRLLVNRPLRQAALPETVRIPA
jgi:hypothetical protein